MATQTKTDLAGLFQTVTQALLENQQALNQADETNQNHGDNMVQTFQTITSALEQKKTSSNSAALAYAAKQLSKNTSSGSGQLYAQNLAAASAQLKGKKASANDPLALLQTLIGGNQSGQDLSTVGANLLGTLLSGQGAQSGADQSAAVGANLLGTLLSGQGVQSGADQSSTANGADLLGSLLSSVAGSTGASSASTGTDSTDQTGGGLTNLMNAGLTYLQAKQSGEGDMQALIKAFMAASGMGTTAHRQQSTEVVINSFLQALNKG